MADNFLKISSGFNLQPVNSDPANPIEGDLQFSDGTHRTKGLWQYKDGAWAEVSGGGGGAGSLDVFDTEDFSTLSSVNASGNNATFLGGGTLDGSFSIETSSPISGGQSGKYTAGSSSNNDYIEIKTIDLDLKQRDTDIKCRLSADMSGFANDVTFVIYDKTNAAVLTDSLDILEANADRSFYEFAVYVPSTCTQISYGFHINNGATNTESFIFDDIEFSTNPFVTQNLIETEGAIFRVWAGYGSTNTRIPYFSNEVRNDTGSVISIQNDSTNGFSITALKDCIVNASYNRYPSGTSNAGWSLNSSELTTNIGSLSNADDRVAWSRQPSIEGESVTVSLKLSAGDVLRPHTAGAGESSSGARANMTVNAIATSEHVITPAKSALSDFQSYTPTWSGLGTVSNNLARYRVIGDSLEIEASVQAGSPSGSINTSFSIPSKYTIDTSKISSSSQNMLGSWTLTEAVTQYTASAKEGYVFSDGASTTDLFLSFQASSDGVMSKHVGGAFVGPSDGIILRITVPIVESSANAKFLAAIPVQKTAYIKDVKVANTAGGTFTSGSWQTRDLNTIEGDGSFLSISSNQFTLPPGKYNIEANAPALSVDRHKIKLRNITDSTDDIIGHSGFAESDAIYLGAGNATLQGQVEITTSKTFELQHRCQTTRATNGFGLESNFGVNEVYSVVKIEKLK